MQDIIDMELEEYIPLKIIFNKDEEAVEYISYSKDKTSSLEFTVGIKSKLLKRITLLLCKEYSETTNKLVVENFEDGKIIFHSDDIIEICVCDMSVSELNHLKKELELQ